MCTFTIKLANAFKTLAPSALEPCASVVKIEPIDFYAFWHKNNTNVNVTFLSNDDMTSAKTDLRSNPSEAFGFLEISYKQQR